jgi:hypothetical protein
MAAPKPLPASGAPKAERIRELNDAFRTAGGPVDWVITRGVASLGPEFVGEAVRAVRAFDDFSADNDPHGEHDFGAFAVAGERLLWKIDYYDQALEFGSEDPADASLTRRVLTVMLAAEY